jgi:RimJ/RimL family protein N-acetyltransferase
MALPKFRETEIKTRAGVITLREVQKKDLKALNEVINEPRVNKFILYPSPVSMKSTNEYYRGNKKNKIRWIACISGNHAVGSFEPRPKAGRESHVANFGIAFSKKVHGKGIAEATARYCFGWMKKNGTEKIVSEVLADNVRARKFYKKVGFRELCPLRRNCRRGKKYVDTIIIEKFL